MEELGLVGTLAVVALAALAGGGLARLLRLPTILGYLAAGLLIGPHTPGFVGDIEQVETIADLGVALLMFTLGVRFSLRDMMTAGSRLIGGAIFQVITMIVIGVLAAVAMGLDTKQGYVIGTMVAMSSTAVALRMLEGRGEVGRPAGTLAVSFSLVQDLSAIALIVTIPVVAGDAEDFLQQLVLAVGKGGLLIAGVWITGIFLVPRIFGLVLGTRSRELFLLTVVALVLGVASISFIAGLSIAFGAFLAGLLVSESEYAHQTLGEIIPLREVFAVVFFVAIGMLIDPSSFAEHPQIVLGVAAIGIFAKVTLITGIMLTFGLSLREALLGGMALGAMAEFSFVLATEGAREGIWDTGISEAVLAAVLLSIAVSPILILALDPMVRALQGAPGLSGWLQQRTDVYVPEPQQLVNHVVICGFDEAAQELARALSMRGFRFMVIDEDPVTFRQLRRRNVPCILGDPSLPAVLEQAELDRARVLAVTTLEADRAEATVAVARSINPRLDIIAEGAGEESHRRMRELGASEVVHPEFEAGLEMVRHTLQRFGVSSQEIQLLLTRRRRDYTRG